MPSVDERLASLEARMDAITELKTAIADLRADMRGQVSDLREDMHGQVSGLREDMNRGFADLREDMTRGFSDLRGDMNRRFERLEHRNDILDAREDRHFLWLLGIQMTVLITVVAALLGSR
jgi:hypothetical protein